MGLGVPNTTIYCSSWRQDNSIWQIRRWLYQTPNAPRGHSQPDFTILFCTQTLYRVGNRRFDRLKTNRNQGDCQG
jgi:hypothetical protein